MLDYAFDVQTCCAVHKCSQLKYPIAQPKKGTWCKSISAIALLLERLVNEWTSRKPQPRTKGDSSLQRKPCWSVHFNCSARRRKLSHCNPYYFGSLHAFSWCFYSSTLLKVNQQNFLFPSWRRRSPPLREHEWTEACARTHTHFTNVITAIHQQYHKTHVSNCCTLYYIRSYIYTHAHTYPYYKNGCVGVCIYITFI